MLRPTQPTHFRRIGLWRPYSSPRACGLRPDASTQEHCILFGAYYPTDTVQEAINCTHDKDSAGNDVSTVAIVPGD